MIKKKGEQMKLRDCTDKICELAKTQVAMICKDDADDCLSKYFTQKCADDDATCKAAREKVAAVCKQQSSPCVDKYYDMDCLPVDKFTINPEQIKAANYTLEGCRGATMGKSSQPSERSDKLDTNLQKPVHTQFWNPFSLGIHAGMKLGGEVIASNSGLDKSLKTEYERAYDLGLDAGLAAINNNDIRLDISLGLGLTIFDMGPTPSYNTFNSSDSGTHEDSIYVFKFGGKLSIYNKTSDSLWVGGSAAVGYAVVSGPSEDAENTVFERYRGPLTVEEYDELDHLFIEPQLNVLFPKLRMGLYAGTEVLMGAAAGPERHRYGLHTTDDTTAFETWSFGIHGLIGSLR